MSPVHPERSRVGLARVARMYHERGMTQPQIAAELHLSQSRVSRLLKQAVEMGVVRTVVVLPPGLHSDLEDALQERFALRDAVVIDTGGAPDPVPALGAGAAAYLEATLTGGDVIGISSWSETLLAAVDVLQRKPDAANEVVQLLGGVGNPNVQFEATRLTSRLAELTGARPVFMPAPGLVGSVNVRRALEKDALVAEVISRWSAVTVALVGIGSLTPSPLLRESGNAMTDAEQDALRQRGAVGDVCLRFFNEEGKHITSPLDKRVLGLGSQPLRAIARRIAVAGGARKLTAIRAALKGGWVNILVTDAETARGLT